MVPPSGKSDYRLTSKHPPTGGPRRNKRTYIQPHTGSLTVKTRIVRNSTGVTLEVAHEGPRLPADILDEASATVTGLGVGIMGMQERLRQLGSRLEIDSRRQGRTVRATPPLSQGDL
jgi:signal transduction histidine kinase